MLEKVPPMVPAAFSTPGKAATPRETLTKETPRKSEEMSSKKGLTPDTTPSHPSRSNKPARPAATGGMILNMAT